MVGGIVDVGVGVGTGIGVGVGAGIGTAVVGIVEAVELAWVEVLFELVDVGGVSSELDISDNKIEFARVRVFGPK